MSLAAVVTERVRRQMPTGLSVLPGSLPVVSFGDPSRAVVATLSLNPSWIEFQSPSGVWLRGPDRRLASLVSLGADDPGNLTDDQVAQAVAECNAYFDGPNWYRAWFHWLESLLRETGSGSYFDGSACHLDLVQWATKPAQGQLPSSVWGRLVEQDRDFLRWQLSSSPVRTVLLNGASVVRWVQQAGLVTGFGEEGLVYAAANGRDKLTVSRAQAEGVLFLGWNKVVAGALAADGRRQLNRWLSQALKEAGRENDPGEGRLGEPAAVPPPSTCLVDGFVPDGTVVHGGLELERVLEHWLKASDRPTVGAVGAFGGSPVITVKVGADQFVLNRDTKRGAVQAFLAAADQARGADNLPWRITANRNGTNNRVSYHSDDRRIPGWYAYVSPAAPEPRALR